MNMDDETKVVSILIDPDQRSITEIQVPVHLLDDGIHTNDVGLDELYRVLDCAQIGAYQMSRDDTCVYCDSDVEEDSARNCFELDGCQPMASRASLIVF